MCTAQDTECGGHISTVGGGYPIVVDGSCLGGIGASGGTPTQDMEVSEAAIEHFHSNS